MSRMSRPLLKSLCLLFVLFALACTTAAPMSAFANSGGGHGGGAKKEDKAPAGEEGEEGGGKDKKKKGQQTVTGGLFEGDPVYVHLKPVIFPVISDAGAEQIIVLLVDLQIKDVDTATMMSATMPRLRDAIIRALYGGLAEGAMRNANALDIDKIKDNIVKTCNKVYGEGTVLDALIQAVSQRKL